MINRPRQIARWARLLLLASAIAVLAACRSKTVSITTEPSGATLYYWKIENGRPVGLRQSIGASPTRFKFEWDSKENHTYRIEAQLFQHRPNTAEVAYEESSARKTEYHIPLTRYQEDIELLELLPEQTPNGLRLAPQSRIARSYYDTIEKSAVARNMTRVTDNRDRSQFFGRPATSPTDDFFIFSILKRNITEPTIYTVQRDDTIEAIALAHDVTVEDLREQNNLTPADRIRRNDELRISRTTYQANLWRQAVRSAQNVQLTRGNFIDSHPTYNPSGELAYYNSNRIENRPAIWHINASAGGNITQITQSNTEDYAPSVSKDGVIVYVSLRPGASGPQIWRIGTDGSNAKMIRNQGVNPDVSPDGKRVAFVQTDSASGKVQIWVMDIDGGNARRLTSNTSHDCVDPSWSPDGNWIAYASNEAPDEEGTENFNIFVMAADGSNNTQLTTNGSWDDKPCWDRSGTTIVFRSNRGGNWNMWRFSPLIY